MSDVRGNTDFWAEHCRRWGREKKTGFIGGRRRRRHDADSLVLRILSALHQVQRGGGEVS